jgi:hypothetical protein
VIQYKYNERGDKNMDLKYEVGDRVIFKFNENLIDGEIEEIDSWNKTVCIKRKLTNGAVGHYNGIKLEDVVHRFSTALDYAEKLLLIEKHLMQLGEDMGKVDNGIAYNALRKELQRLSKEKEEISEILKKTIITIDEKGEM